MTGLRLLGIVAMAVMGLASTELCAQPASDSVGSVASMKAPANITRNARSVALKVGDDIYKGDTLQTGASGALGVTFDDETTLNLTANASLTINDYVYVKGGKKNAALMNVSRGTVAFFASQVAKTGDMKITTPTATIGIRGTTGLVDVPDGSRPGAQVSVKLYPDSGGSVGRIEVFGRDGARIGELAQAATGLAIALGAGSRFAAIPLVISPQQAALDRGLVQRVFSVQGLGRRFLQQRILRLPDLQRRLNIQNLVPGLPSVPGLPGLPGGTPSPQRPPSNNQRLERQQPQIPTIPTPTVPSIPRIPSIPGLGR